MISRVSACRTRGATVGGFGVLRKRFSACKSSKSRCMRNTVFSNATTGDHSSFCRCRPAASAPWSVKLSGANAVPLIINRGPFGRSLPSLRGSRRGGVWISASCRICCSGPGCRESPSPVRPYPSVTFRSMNGNYLTDKSSILVLVPSYI